MVPARPAADETWEQVLAALEADIRRTERTMRTPAEISEAVLHHPAPSQTQLPAAMPSMPPVYAMPPISPEVEERIRELRVRIEALQLQLRDELAMLRTSAMVTRPRLAPVADLGAAQFIDSRV